MDGDGCGGGTDCGNCGDPKQVIELLPAISEPFVTIAATPVVATAGVVVPMSLADTDAALATSSCVINFCASWCEPCEHMNIVFKELASENSNLCFLQVCTRSFPHQHPPE